MVPSCLRAVTLIKFLTNLWIFMKLCTNTTSWKPTSRYFSTPYRPGEGEGGKFWGWSKQTKETQHRDLKCCTLKAINILKCLSRNFFIATARNLHLFKFPSSRNNKILRGAGDAKFCMTRLLHGKDFKRGNGIQLRSYDRNNVQQCT